MSAAAGHAAVPGLDLDTIAKYLKAECPGLFSGPLQAQLIQGGHSNLTYEVSDGTNACIVRRPPLGHVLATAHDMVREHRVMSQLASTSVPVPRTYAVCVEDTVLGAPFLVMEKIEGATYRRIDELTAVGSELTKLISQSMIDTLADLHQLDPVSVGLGDFGMPYGFLARQFQRWNTQLASSHSRVVDGAAELSRLLEQGLPNSRRAAIVHGDYRIDNLLIGNEGRIAAVLDWEMATVGDPMADLGLMIAYQHTVDGLNGAAPNMSTAAGFLSPNDALDRYASRIDVELPDLTFYIGLGYFKRAVICETIFYRHLQGQAIGPRRDTFGAAVPPLIKAGTAVLKGTL